jgi:hypothetical protein
MGGAVPPFPTTPSGHGVHLKHRDNFTEGNDKIKSLYLTKGYVFKTCHHAMKTYRRVEV